MITKRVKLESTPTPPPADADDGDHCIICLQDIIDRTVLPACTHNCFCFDCVVVWTEQSRKCPLCQQAIGPYLVHHVRSHLDFSKFYLPPLRSSPLAEQPSRPHEQRHPNTRSARIRAWGRRELRREEDAEYRALQRRKWVYSHGCYAKHVASNSYTKYRPYPTPTQFTSQPDLVSRTTAFVRRELMVWDNIDVEFLTTFVISLMKSIDLRSEVAIKLLSEFLDMGSTYVEGNRYPNTEHFVHEVYSYIRSPFRELSVYDAQVQYDKPEARFSPLMVDRQKRTAPARTNPPLHVNESLSSLGFRPPSPPQSCSRYHQRDDSLIENSENIRVSSPPSRTRKRLHSSSDDQRSPPLRSNPSSPQRAHRSPLGSPLLATTSQNVALFQQTSRLGSPQPSSTDAEVQRDINGSRLSETIAAGVVRRSEEDEPRKGRPPLRTPRQTALSSIHAHLGLGGQRKVKIDRRPLSERMTVTESGGSNSIKITSSVRDATVAPTDDVSMCLISHTEEQEQATTVATQRSPSEVMALTRARLAELKTHVKAESDTPSTQKAEALRMLLFARLEEEKKLAVATENTGIRPDSEERRLRLAAKLAAEKRRASSTQGS